MLNKIIQFSLQNRLFILIASVLLMIGGLYQAYHTEVDVFPDLNAPTVVVMTEAGGHGSSKEVEQLVTFPIETAVNGATSVRRVRSSSTTGFSVVWVEFDWDTDIYLARQIVSEKLATVAESLPDNVGNPDSGTAIFHSGRIAYRRTDSRQHVYARLAYIGRLGDSPTPDVHRRSSPSSRIGRRHQGIPGSVAPRTDETLRSDVGRGNGCHAEHEYQHQRRSDLPIRQRNTSYVESSRPTTCGKWAGRSSKP